VVTELGPPEVIALRDVPDPGPPADDEVRVRVMATGVNPSDAKIRRGIVALPDGTMPPYVTGREAAGVVVAAGAASGFAVGDAVFSFFRWSARPGGAAEEVVVPADLVARRPPDVPAEVAAAVPLAGTTAYQTLRALAAPSGSPLVVVGASGGVGTFLVPLARRAGHEVVALASSTSRDYLDELGATDIVDYGDTDAVGALAARFPRGAPWVVDLVGPAAREVLAALVGEDTTAITIAGGWDSRGRALPVAPVAPDAADLTALGRLLSGGSWAPRVRTFALDDVVAAHRQLDSGHTRGKVVVVIGS
jgi:NADPH:quinone reductase-like Zn-dependent oxidoreductase